MRELRKHSTNDVKTEEENVYTMMTCERYDEVVVSTLFVASISRVPYG
jgi:hypothetical protein